MAKLYSNELKALVVPENFLENPKNVLKDHCLTVQHFDYQCDHKRNSANEVYGPVEPVMLQFTVRVNSPAHARVFYQNLMENSPADYSFLFNTTFNGYHRIEDYDDGMVVNAYVVKVEEHYNSGKNEAGEDEQILLEVTLQTRSVTYLGSDRNFKSVFIQ